MKWHRRPLLCPSVSVDLASARRTASLAHSASLGPTSNTAWAFQAVRGSSEISFCMVGKSQITQNISGGLYHLHWVYCGIQGGQCPNLSGAAAPLKWRTQLTGCSSKHYQESRRASNCSVNDSACRVLVMPGGAFLDWRFEAVSGP